MVVSDIKKLPRMYNVSRQDIETILGIKDNKEKSIWKGGELSESEGKKVLKAMEDPSYVLKQMIKNKDKMRDGVYERAVVRIKSLLYMSGKDYAHI